MTKIPEGLDELSVALAITNGGVLETKTLREFNSKGVRKQMYVRGFECAEHYTTRCTKLAPVGTIALEHLLSLHARGVVRVTRVFEMSETTSRYCERCNRERRRAAKELEYRS